jgi:hypothetical protein
MSMFRAYETDSGAVAIASTAAVPLLYLAVPATAEAHLAKIKVMVEAATSPSPPSNASVLFTFNKVTGTVGGGAAVTPAALGPSGVASALTALSGTTAITGLTQGGELWAGAVPFTAGASWADDHENTGLEITLTASGLYAAYFTAAAGAGSGMTARIITWHAE